MKILCSVILVCTALILGISQGHGEVMEETTLAEFRGGANCESANCPLQQNPCEECIQVPNTTDAWERCNFKQEKVCMTYYYDQFVYNPECKRRTSLCGGDLQVYSDASCVQQIVVPTGSCLRNYQNDFMGGDAEYAYCPPMP